MEMKICSSQENCIFSLFTTIARMLIVAIAAFAGGLIAGRMTMPHKGLVVDAVGRIERREIPAWTATTNTADCCRERNAILADYGNFLSTPPRLLSVTDSEIRFSIRSNEYALGYRLSDVPSWHWAPIIACRARISGEGILPSLGIGFMADYADIGCGVILGGAVPMKDIDVTGMLYVRF